MDCDAFFMDPGRTIDSVIHMYSSLVNWKWAQKWGSGARPNGKERNRPSQYLPENADPLVAV